MNLSDNLKRFFNLNGSLPVYIGFSQINGTKNTFPTSQVTNTAQEICVRIIANTIASIPINLYKSVDGFKEVIKTDIRYKTLHHRPNGYTNRFTFWHTMEMAKQKYGNSYAVIHKFENDIQLEYFHPTLLVKTYFEEGFLKYIFKTDEGDKTFDASLVIHFKRDSVDGVFGVDPYTVLSEEIKRTYLANKTITNYYENDGKSTKFLKTTVTTGDIAKLEKAADRFREEAGGSYYDKDNKIVKGDFDKIVAFPRLPGNSEIQVIPNDQNDDLYLSTIEKSDLNIAAYYGIPPHYLNILQSQKNSNVETMQLDFKSSTISHILNQNRQELEMKLLKTYEIDSGMSIEYNVNSILELSSAERMKQYESLQKTAFMTPNEVRKIESMSRIDGGDSHYIFEQMTTIEGLNKDGSIN